MHVAGGSSAPVASRGTRPFQSRQCHVRTFPAYQWPSGDCRASATFERRNPLDGTLATRAPAASLADATRAADAAAEAFRTWSETGPGERRTLLLKAAEKLEAKMPQFVAAIVAETGATSMWAGFNVKLAAGVIREAAALTTQVAGEVIPSDVPGSLAMAIRQPAGVVLGIAP